MAANWRTLEERGWVTTEPGEGDMSAVKTKPHDLKLTEALACLHCTKFIVEDAGSGDCHFVLREG